MEKLRAPSIGCVLILFLAGCTDSPGPPEETDFLAPRPGEIEPWTRESFDSANEKFTFAVHSDLTGGERDHIYEVAIANLLMEGILDKTGQIPLNGDELCFESARCSESE